MKRFGHIVPALLWAYATLSGQVLADGIAAVEAGRLDDAVRILTSSPESFERNFYLGLAHFRASRPAAARPFLETAASLAPRNAQAWKVLGLATTSTGDLDAAVPALRRACELAPRDQEGCYFLGRDLYSLGRYEAARAPFETALRAASGASKPRVHRAMALNFAALGSPAEAERHFLEAIRARNPDPDDARVDYGAFLFRQGRTEAALPPLQAAVRDSPLSGRANLELGRVLLHLERTEEALSRLEKAVELMPADFNAHLLLGRAYLRAGRTADGERHLRLGQKGWAAGR
jgi:tetratricopeptide (TPR) repeat protein